MRIILLFSLAGVLLISSCGDRGTGSRRLMIATTTSLYDTGLWDALEPMFENEYGIDIDVVYAGTGRAFELGRRGDADVLVVHSQTREEEFVHNGYALERIPLAFNYYVIVGPPDDPAGISGKTPGQAFAAIAASGAEFISRGDDSGTHGREKEIWVAAGFNYEGISTSENWYIMGGSGMGATLTMADEMVAYTLSDIGTFLSYREKLELQPLVESGEILLNVYSIMKVVSTHMPEEAELFIGFMTSQSIQEFICEYGVSEYGTALFTPCFGSGL